jgi:hypothetical protein
VPTGSTLRRVDGAAGVLSRWPWRPADGRPQGFDSAASRCTPPARPRAGLRPSGCLWSGHGLPCAPAAWPGLCLSAWLDAFHRAPDSGAAGVSFALGFRAWPEDKHQGTTGGALLFRKRPWNVEWPAPGGSFHGKRRKHPIQINYLEPNYFFVTCWGMLGGKVWNTRPAGQRLSVDQGGMAYRPGIAGPSCAP